MQQFDSFLSDKLAREEDENDDQVQMIEQYIDNYKVTFELRAINDDGEVLAKVSSSESAYDVSTQSATIDYAIYELAEQDRISRAEYLAEARDESIMEDENGILQTII